MDPILTWAEALNVYRDYGIGALFLVMYLVTVSKLIGVLVKGRDKEIERCTQLVVLAESMTEASKAQTQILEKLKDSIESDRHETERLHTYLQARDARGRRP